MNSKLSPLNLEEHINYMGWADCLRIRNSEVELIIATEIGIRILHFGFIGGKNIFYLSPDDKGKKGGLEWRIYGGHRLWHAPEAIPRTYSPDNDPVSYTLDADTLRISQRVEKETGIVKQLDICLSAERNEVKLVHRLINKNQWPVELSPWAITVLEPGGTAIIPQEPYGEGNEYLLPARSMSLWSYTSMQDKRWSWGNKYILARQDITMNTEQKIGVLNKMGWAAYFTDSHCFIKRFGFDPKAVYPDFGSNYEVYINGAFLESETLGAVETVLPEGKTEHIEYWHLSVNCPDGSDESIDQIIFPQLAALTGIL